MTNRKSRQLSPGSSLRQKLGQYARLVFPQVQEPSLSELVNHINGQVKINGTNKKLEKRSQKLLTENDLYQAPNGNIPIIAEWTLAIFFGASRPQKEIPGLSFHLSPRHEHPVNSAALVAEIANCLKEVFDRRTPKVKTLTELEQLKGLVFEEPRPALEALFDLDQSGDNRLIDKDVVKSLNSLRRSGNVLALQQIIDQSNDKNKLTPKHICELAALLTKRACGEEVEITGEDFAESKNFERSRSQILQLRWPKPYRDQFGYVESSINRLKKLMGPFEDFFVRRDDAKPCPEFEPARFGDLSTNIPTTADNYAFLYDPLQVTYLNDKEHFKISTARPLDEWKVPTRLKRPLYLSLVRAIRRRELLEDKMLIGIESGLSGVNQKLKLHKCRFSAVVGTHYTAGVSIFQKNGDTVFDGLSHIANDGQWKLMRTQLCPNVLRISSLIITSDHFMFVIFGAGNSFFRKKTWLPPVSGFVTYDDYENLSGIENLTIRDIAMQTIRRKLGTEFSLDRSEVEDAKIEIVGLGFDVVHSRIPTLFAVTRIARTKETLTSVLKDRVYRMFELVEDDTRYSFLEILESSAYQDAELFRANLFFTMKFDTDLEYQKLLEAKKRREEQLITQKKNTPSEYLG